MELDDPSTGDDFRSQIARENEENRWVEWAQNG
jgi:hypothetical protein